MKITKKLIILFLILFSFSVISVKAAGVINITDGSNNTNLKKSAIQQTNTAVGKNDRLKNLNSGGINDNFFTVSDGGEKGWVQTLFNIAKSLKNVLFSIAGLYFLILVVKLVFTENTEEEVGKFKKGIIWITLGLMVTQISYSFVKVLYDQGASEGLAYRFLDNIVYPLIKLLETGASFLFIAIAIYAYFRMVTAHGEEDKVKQGRMSILYSVIGFIVIKISRAIVDTIYGKVDCNNVDNGFIQISSNDCVITENLNGAVEIIYDIINWANSLIGIVILILIIYTGVQVIFSNGDEEVLKKAKSSIMYIAIGIMLLFINYLILTFFIIPETAI